jgi:glycosyltransferase involved in cell wall biosynthesis
VDDGSKDRGGAICDVWAARDNRIRVLHKENEGVSSARNTGMEIAQGDFVMFCDSDDYLCENTMVSELANVMLQRKCDLVTYGCKKIGTDGTEEKTTFVPCEYQFENTHEVTDFIAHVFIEFRMAWETWTKMYRRDMIKKYHLQFEDTRKVLAEDICFDLNYLFYCRSVYETGTTPYCYVRREGSITLSGVKTSPDSYVNLINSILGNLKDNQVRLDAKDMAILFVTWLNREIGLLTRVNYREKQKQTHLDGIAQDAYRAIRLKDCIQCWGIKHGMVKYHRVKKYFSCVENVF